MLVACLLSYWITHVVHQAGAVRVPWAPVQESGDIQQSSVFMPESPDYMRRMGLFEHVPSIVGLETDAAAEKASRSIHK